MIESKLLFQTLTRETGANLSRQQLDYLLCSLEPGELTDRRSVTQTRAESGKATFKELSMRARLFLFLCIRMESQSVYTLFRCLHVFFFFFSEK